MGNCDHLGRTYNGDCEDCTWNAAINACQALLRSAAKSAYKRGNTVRDSELHNAVDLLEQLRRKREGSDE